MLVPHVEDSVGRFLATPPLFGLRPDARFFALEERSLKTRALIGTEPFTVPIALPQTEQGLDGLLPPLKELDAALLLRLR